jgi:hypothetical protein
MSLSCITMPSVEVLVSMELTLFHENLKCLLIYVKLILKFDGW